LSIQQGLTGLKTQKNLTLTVYNQIKEMMLNYDIIPGQRLIFVDIAKQIGVSRTPVNNALSILANEGYLDFIPNQGYSVHILTEKEANYLFEIREMIEIGVIGQAIRKMTDKKLEKLEQCKVDYEKAISDRVHRKLFILDTEFHASTIEMMDNPILVDRYREVCQKIFLRFRVEDLLIDRIREIVREHDEIFHSLRTKDVERAKELLNSHNNNAKKNLFAIIFQNEKTKTKLKSSAPRL
jgi:DNA-binding GntR family transcriptional regulator